MIIRGPLAIVFAVVLLLSVATNLVIAGFVVARLNSPPPAGNDIERIVAIGIRAFPPKYRRRSRRPCGRSADDVRERVDAVKEARRKMFEAMRANPFDQAALEAAYADLRAKTNDLQEVGQEITLQAVANAPPDVRQRIRPPRGPFP